MPDSLPDPAPSPSDPARGDRRARAADPSSLDPYFTDDPFPEHSRLRLRRSGGRWYIVPPTREA